MSAVLAHALAVLSNVRYCEQCNVRYVTSCTVGVLACYLVCGIATSHGAATLQNQIRKSKLPVQKVPGMESYLILACAASDINEINKLRSHYERCATLRSHIAKHNHRTHCTSSCCCLFDFALSHPSLVGGCNPGTIEYRDAATNHFSSTILT